MASPVATTGFPAPNQYGVGTLVVGAGNPALSPYVAGVPLASVGGNTFLDQHKMATATTMAVRDPLVVQNQATVAPVTASTGNALLDQYQAQLETLNKAYLEAAINTTNGSVFEVVSKSMELPYYTRATFWVKAGIYFEAIEQIHKAEKHGEKLDLNFEQAAARHAPYQAYLKKHEPFYATSAEQLALEAAWDPLDGAAFATSLLTALKNGTAIPRQAAIYVRRRGGNILEYVQLYFQQLAQSPGTEDKAATKRVLDFAGYIPLDEGVDIVYLTVDRAGKVAVFDSYESSDRDSNVSRAMDTAKAGKVSGFTRLGTGGPYVHMYPVLIRGEQPGLMGRIQDY